MDIYLFSLKVFVNGVFHDLLQATVHSMFFELAAHVMDELVIYSTVRGDVNLC